MADLRRMPAALIDHGRLRKLYRYLPVEQAAPRETSGPVLLVPPLAAPYAERHGSCWTGISTDDGYSPCQCAG